MALMLLFDAEARRALRRERLFRDRRNPLDALTDSEIYQRYRFTRNGIVRLLERVELERDTKVIIRNIAFNFIPISKDMNRPNK